MKNLVLICGGASPEHDISVRSAKNILSALDRTKYFVHLVGITRDGKWLTLDEEELQVSVPDQGNEIHIVPGDSDCFRTETGSIGKVDVVFPVLHGPNGEDGAIQGLLQMLKVPFVGPDLLGSSVSMDKDMAKRVLTQQGIKVAKWVLVRREDVAPSFEEIRNELGSIVFVKPANMGSSVGVNRVTSEKEWVRALKEALSFDRKVLVEEQLVGREIECAVLGNESPVASGVGEVKSGEVYTYEKKYADSSSAQTVIPADVSDDQLVRLREVALASYRALECLGLSRVDMFLTESDEIFVNEVNTMPGFTSISMYPKLWNEEGVSYSDLLDRLVDLGLEKA